MDTNILFSLCSSIVIWWNEQKNNDENVTMPDFVRQAIGVIGDTTLQENPDTSVLYEGPLSCYSEDELEWRS